jgi:hypothetical protein
MHNTTIPSGSFVRVRQIVGGDGQPGLLPIKKSTWYAWVQQGRAPAGKKISGGCTVWSRAAVLALAQGEGQ